MFSEAFHSLVDTGNEMLLLYGVHRKFPDNTRHPSPLLPAGGVFAGGQQRFTGNRKTERAYLCRTARRGRMNRICKGLGP